MNRWPQIAAVTSHKDVGGTYFLSINQLSPDPSRLSEKQSTSRLHIWDTNGVRLTKDEGIDLSLVFGEVPFRNRTSYMRIVADDFSRDSARFGWCVTIFQDDVIRQGLQTLYERCVVIGAGRIIDFEYPITNSDIVVEMPLVVLPGQARSEVDLHMTELVEGEDVAQDKEEATPVYKDGNMCFLKDGTIAVIFEERSNNPLNHEKRILYAIVGRDGSIVSAPSLCRADGQYQFNGFVAARESGFLAVWGEFESEHEKQGAVWLQNFDAKGQRVGECMRITEGWENVRIDQYSIASNRKCNRLAIILGGVDGTGKAPLVVSLRRLSNPEAPLRPYVRIDVPGQRPRGAIHDNGNFALAYMTYVGDDVPENGRFGIVLTIRDSQGSPLMPNTLISPLSSGYYRRPCLAWEKDTIGIVWQEETDFELGGREFGEEGRVIHIRDRQTRVASRFLQMNSAKQIADQSPSSLIAGERFAPMMAWALDSLLEGRERKEIIDELRLSCDDRRLSDLAVWWALRGWLVAGDVQSRPASSIVSFLLSILCDPDIAGQLRVRSALRCAYISAAAEGPLHLCLHGPLEDPLILCMLLSIEYPYLTEYEKRDVEIVLDNLVSQEIIDQNQKRIVISDTGSDISTSINKVLMDLRAYVIEETQDVRHIPIMERGGADLPTPHIDALVDYLRSGFRGDFGRMEESLAWLVAGALEYANEIDRSLEFYEMLAEKSETPRVTASALLRAAVLCKSCLPRRFSRAREYAEHLISREDLEPWHLRAWFNLYELASDKINDDNLRVHLLEEHIRLEKTEVGQANALLLMANTLRDMHEYGRSNAALEDLVDRVQADADVLYTASFLIGDNLLLLGKAEDAMERFAALKVRVEDIRRREQVLFAYIYAAFWAGKTQTAVNESRQFRQEYPTSIYLPKLDTLERHPPNTEK